MKSGRIALISLMLALVAWLFFTWPLPRYITSGIPSSSQNVEKNSVRTMIPGDHLQLLYHFWLFTDMLRGSTPWFYNVYEFNLGDDHAREHRTAGFFPFFVFHAAGETLAGHAFGYNFASFIAVWLLVWSTAFLVRRYATHAGVLWTATLVGSLLPYRWATLLGGSPSGFSLMWIPLFLLGLDIVVRDFRLGGGVFALAVALLMSLSDMHALFFTLLIAPFWCIFALAARPAFNWRGRDDYLRLLRALLPMLVLPVFAVIYQALWRARTAGTVLPSGRSYGEVALFSPSAIGFIDARIQGPSSYIYIGLPLLILLAAGLIAACVAVRRGRREARAFIPLVLLILALLGIGSLALGTNGPFRGLLLVAVRKLVPPYSMLRQPAKIFVLMPPLLAVASALSLTALFRFIPNRHGRNALFAFSLVLIALNFDRRVCPTICLLDREQGAYQAVAEYARAEGRLPRALVLPLWPGDQINSSPYQYYALLYRLRMVNGYHPLVGKDYLDEYRRLRVINQGLLSDGDADRLLDRGIDALLLHEDAYPETVSPFGVSVTLDRLLSHPRLDPLGRDGSVWAFRILPADRARKPAQRDPGFYFPARRWEAETFSPPTVRTTADDRGTEFVTLKPGAGEMKTSPCRVVPAPDLRWMIRARGRGVLMVETAGPMTPIASRTIHVASSAWAWLASPLPENVARKPIQLALRADVGSADVDMALLAAGDWLSLGPGESARIPADRFFHAGWSDPETGAVHFRKDYEPTWIVFYGPKQPLERGTYEASLDFSSPATAGTEIGRVNVRLRESDPVTWHPLRAGEPWRVRFTQEDHLPVSLELYFTREADMTVRAVTFTRVR
ncbi:MAG: hypothetical protein JXB04_05985 [Kiritimatiellae bacterium]|nr:hypothetical protein [Kiritimatiellia bacterium]